MAGDWKATLSYTGPRGAGPKSFTVAVQWSLAADGRERRKPGWTEKAGAGQKTKRVLHELIGRGRDQEGQQTRKSHGKNANYDTAGRLRRPLLYISVPSLSALRSTHS